MKIRKRAREVVKFGAAVAAGLGIISSLGAHGALAEPNGTAYKHRIVTSIEPPYWWVGMANDTLQLLVNGPGVADAQFATDYPGVKIIEQLSLDSKNYKLLYLTIADDAKAGEVKFDMTMPTGQFTVYYPLLARDRAAEEYTGFDAGDVLYLMMPDRFAREEQTSANGKKGKRAKLPDTGLEFNTENNRERPNSRHGGNIAGIRKHLDYIDSLGVTAIWVCPVLENDMPGGSYHGYATTNYYRIDPRFGSNAEWEQLVEEAHGKGLKVVMDMIFNHTGSNHPWMKDAPSKDWYNHPDGKTMTNYRLTTVHDPYVSDYDLDHTVNGWFVPSMPDLNQRNPHVMKYLIQNSIWWIEGSKIDGIRMDTYPYADMKGMSQWGADVMKEYPNFNIVGECWYGNEAGGAFWQKGSRLNPNETNLPTVMDFWMVINGRNAFNGQTNPWQGLNYVYDHLSNDFLFENPQKILTFLDNHDTDRFLAEVPESVDSLGSWKQAITFLLTSRGIPQIYYGTELLMAGSKEGSDGYVRRDFPGGFPGDEVNAFTREGRSEVQNAAWDFISNLLQWRRGDAKDVMTKGSLKHFMPQNGIYAYQRKLGDKEVMVLMNGNDKENRVTMERTLEVLPYGTRMRDVISGKEVTIEPEMTFGPREVMVLANF